MVLFSTSGEYQSLPSQTEFMRRLTRIPAWCILSTASVKSSKDCAGDIRPDPPYSCGPEIYISLMLFPLHYLNLKISVSVSESLLYGTENSSVPIKVSHSGTSQYCPFDHGPGYLYLPFVSVTRKGFGFCNSSSTCGIRILFIDGFAFD